MRYYLLPILLILFSNTISSQKKYSFDYIAEYDFKKNETSKIEKRYVLTNSEDDSYSVYVSEVDQLTFSIDFRDEKGIRSISTINKDDFLKAETVLLNCEDVRYQRGSRKYDLGRFVFSDKKDTLINSVSYKYYTLKYRKNVEAKRYKRGLSYYIIGNSTEFHPPLMMFSSIFDVSVTSKNRPNGIAKEIFSISQDGKRYEFIYKLSHFLKVRKFLEIPSQCDYTNPKITRY